MFDSFEAALRLAEGYALVDVIGQEEMLFSEHYACPYCGFTVGELNLVCSHSMRHLVHVQNVMGLV